MYCRVRDCIYNESGTCGLDETEINENGECEWIDRKTEPKLCRECEEYAGDGMYCASNHLVYDFDTCKVCHEYADEHGALPMEHPRGCPLVEVKEPHGDLIDKSRVYDETLIYADHVKSLVSRIVDCAPTVIKAEGK